MLPNFLIIGAVKAGTTWLSVNLRQHPDIFMAAEKEVKFFTRHYEKGVDWYAAHFAEWNGQTAVGEATPLYLARSYVPARIKKTLGDNLKFIVSLRHPVDRAHSAFWFQYMRRRTIEPGDDFLTLFRQGKYFLSPGNYFTHLSRYLDYFPLENFLVLIHEEDVSKKPQQGLERCFTFLDVDPHFTPDKLGTKVNKAGNIRLFHNQIWACRQMLRSIPPGFRSPLAAAFRKPLEIVGSRVLEVMPKKQNGYEALDKALRQELLAQYYSDEIDGLEQLLGRDLSVWYNPS